MSHHPEIDDAPYVSDASGSVDPERPYGDATPHEVIVDFGETYPVRLNGCPNCGYRDVAFTASRCYHCKAEFTPACELPPRTG